MLSDPFGGSDIISSIRVVFCHSCCNGENIGIENDITVGHACLLSEQIVASLGDFYLALVADSLPLFVK